MPIEPKRTLSTEASERDVSPPASNCEEAPPSRPLAIAAIERLQRQLPRLRPLRDTRDKDVEELRIAQAKAKQTEDSYLECFTECQELIAYLRQNRLSVAQDFLHKKQLGYANILPRRIEENAFDPNRS